MAITANAAVFEYGTQVTVISDASAIANGAFNAGTVTPLTPTDKVPLADLMLDITFAVAPVAGKVVNVYRRDLNIDGANSAPVPDNNFKQTYIGSFVVDAVITRQFLSLHSVPIGPDQEFYIENATGQSTSGTTILKVTPKTYNGKAA